MGAWGRTILELLSICTKSQNYVVVNLCPGVIPKFFPLHLMTESNDTCTQKPPSLFLPEMTGISQLVSYIKY